MPGAFRFSLFLKVAVIAVVVAVLAVPLALEYGIVQERRHRRDSVVSEVAAAWGGGQVVGGPVLVVPFRHRSRTAEDAQWTKPWANAYFLPEEVELDGTLAPEVRKRGIFEVVVYRATLHLTGRFAPVEVGGWPFDQVELDWSAASLRLAVSDLHGLRGAELSWDGRPLQPAPGGGVDGLWSDGLGARIGPAAAGTGAEAEHAADSSSVEHRFEAHLTLLGSETFEVLPVGVASRVRLASSWPDPSFLGGFLPEEHEVGAKGFTARWSVLDLAQGLPRQWWDGAIEAQEGRPAGRNAAAAHPVAGGNGLPRLGVALYRPVDHYQMTERSMKYSLLFLLLTFVTVFLHELTGRVTLHPMHYLLVGAALVLFYLLLLALTEHVAFFVAYLVASAAVVLQVTAYAAAVLRERRRALTLGLVTALLYAYFGALLAAEDNALLLGAVGLFVTLGLVMYLTRRIDWSAPVRTSRGRIAEEPGGAGGGT